jgi:hypothetical protein
VKEISKIRNDPSFSYLYEQQAQKPNIGSRPALSQKPVIARKMEVKSETKANWNSDEVMCPVHSKPHSLNACNQREWWEWHTVLFLVICRPHCPLFLNVVRKFVNDRQYTPTWGVAKIWERLDERFGAPEMVEAAIKERLSSFPQIGNKDNKKLYEP